MKANKFYLKSVSKKDMIRILEERKKRKSAYNKFKAEIYYPPGSTAGVNSYERTPEFIKIQTALEEAINQRNKRIADWKNRKLLKKLNKKFYKKKKFKKQIKFDNKQNANKQNQNKLYDEFIK